MPETTPPNPIHAVLDPEVFAVLEAATALIHSQPNDDEAARQLIREAGLPSSARAAALTQLELRQAAESKFGHYARSLLFTREGLEQATRLNVAALHAQRYRTAGCHTVADLGCGIGANAVALAGLGLAVQAWDRDPVAVAAATVNLRFFPNCSTYLGDVTEVSLASLVAEGVDAIFCDPARRSGAQRGNRRLFGPQQWSPSLPQVWQWREVMRKYGRDNVGIKVGPGLDYGWIPQDFHAQWISQNGSLVDASLWSPGLSPQGRGRTAVVIGADRTLTLSSAKDPSSAAPALPVVPLNDYLWEVDPAIVRAGVLADFADQAGAAGIVSPGIGYLTSSQLPESRWAPGYVAFEVLEVTALKAKAITAALRTLIQTGEDAAVPADIEVKKRGADVDPQQLRRVVVRELTKRADTTERPKAPKGSALTVIATRIQGRHRAIIARRVDRSLL